MRLTQLHRTSNKSSCASTHIHLLHICFLFLCAHAPFFSFSSLVLAVEARSLPSPPLLLADPVLFFALLFHLAQRTPTFLSVPCQPKHKYAVGTPGGMTQQEYQRSQALLWLLCLVPCWVECQQWCLCSWSQAMLVLLPAGWDAELGLEWEERSL